MPFKLTTPENRVRLVLTVEEDTQDGETSTMMSHIELTIPAAKLVGVNKSPRLQYIIREALKPAIDELLQAYCEVKLVHVDEQKELPLADPTMPLPPGLEGGDAAV